MIGPISGTGYACGFFKIKSGYLRHEFADIVFIVDLDLESRENEQKGESGSRSESVTVARAFLAVWQSQFGSRRQTTKSASYRSTSTISPGDVRELKYTYTYSITLKFNLLMTSHRKTSNNKILEAHAHAPSEQ